MISYYFRSVKESALQKIDVLRPGTWVHVENPNEEEIQQLVENLGLEQDLLQDAIDQHEVPRFENEGEISYFFTRFPNRKDGELGTSTMLLAITPTAVVTVTKEHPVFLDDYINEKKSFYTTQRTKLFLLLITGVNESYKRNLFSIRKEVQQSRVHLRQIHSKDIIHLVGLETTLNNFISALIPSSVAIRTLLSGTHLKLYEEDENIVEDIQLENQQQIETTKTELKTIQNIRSAYMAIVTNSLNSVIKLLTALTIILTIPTILGSLYGMNITLPFAEAPYAFFGIVLTAIFGMAAAAFIFVKRDWM